jgi:hypothetical protein
LVEHFPRRYVPARMQTGFSDMNRFVGRGFSRDINSPNKRGFSP